MRLLSILAPVLVLGSQLVQASNNAQVYLYPVPAAQPHLSAPILTSAQAKAVISHHLGETLADFEEVPQDEAMWTHLMGMWSKERSSGRVVVVEGVSPQDVLPSTLSTPTFYVSKDSSLFAPYIHRASQFLKHVLNSLPNFTKSFKDVFELAGTKAAQTLSAELSALTVLADSLVDKLDAVYITALKDVHGDVLDTGRKGVQAGLEAMTTPGSPPLLLVIMPASNVARSFAPKAGSNSSLAACYTSNSTCSSSTDCNGRGRCALKSKTQPGANDAECWGCRCKSGYAGVDCQKIDYSIPFVILVFSTILLVGLLVGSVALLYTIGDEKLPSTLTLAIGGHMKRD